MTLLYNPLFPWTLNPFNNLAFTCMKVLIHIRTEEEHEISCKVILGHQYNFLSSTALWSKGIKTANHMSGSAIHFLFTLRMRMRIEYELGLRMTIGSIFSKLEKK